MSIEKRFKQSPFYKTSHGEVISHPTPKKEKEARMKYFEELFNEVQPEDKKGNK